MGGQWDALQFAFLAEDSDLLRAVQDGPFQNTSVNNISAAPYIPVDGSYDAYLGTLSSNERQKIRSRRRKLLERGGVSYASVPPEKHEQTLAALFDLHERRAEQKSMISSFRGPAIERFHRALLKILPAEWVWFRVLRHDQDIIGVFYGYCLAGRVFYYQLGYNPAWSAMSPGAVLLQETIREAFDQGCIEYNFLQGGEGFKYHWTTRRRQLFHGDVFGPTWRGQISRLGRHLRRLAGGARRKAKSSTARARVYLYGK